MKKIMTAIAIVLLASALYTGHANAGVTKCATLVQSYASCTTIAKIVSSCETTYLAGTTSKIKRCLWKKVKSCASLADNGITDVSGLWSKVKSKCTYKI